MQANSTTKLEPHFRVKRCGFDFSVSNARIEGNSIRHRVCLTRDSVPVACEIVARNSKFGVADLELRIRRGLINPTTDMYRALVELAELAEGLYGDAKPVAGE